MNIVRNGISNTKARLDWLSQEISDNNIKLNALRKETDDLKLSLETSQEISNNKVKEINNKLKNHKQQHVNEIDYLLITRRNNVRKDELKEIGNET